MTRLVVLNPSSKDFEAEKRWPEIRAKLEAHGPIEVLETSADEEATHIRLVEELKKGFERVISIGGDGTLHAILNALMSFASAKPELAVIPFGTANDVAKSLELPARDLDRLAAIAIGDKTTPLDIGCVSVTRDEGKVSKAFVDAVTIGMDADVLASRSRFRALPGYLGFLPALAERAVEQQSLDVRAVVDEEVIDTRVFNVIINNARIYAGELEMPNSKQDDGLLDLYLFNRREYASKLISFAIKQADVLKLGFHELLEDLTENQRAFHGRSIKLRLASPRKVQVDGEIFGKTDEVEASVLTQLQVAVD